MQRIKLSEKVEFSRIIQGFWRLTDWNVSAQETARQIEGCLERGVTTFDTAERYGYGACEEALGQALKLVSCDRSKYQIVTKTGISWAAPREDAFGFYDTRYARIVRSCKESLRKLGCEYIDLLLIHREDPLLDPWEVAAAFQDLKKEGLILEAGVSNFDPFKFNALNHAMGGTLVTNQIEWHPACFEHFRSGMIDLLMEKKVHPMVWSPLAGGRLFTSQEPTFAAARKKITEIAQKHGVSADAVAYAWILYHPVGAMPICGSRKLERLDKAVEALEVQLTHQEWYEIYVSSGQQVLR